MLTFTCLNFARNFIRRSLIWRVIYNRESSAVKIRTNKVTYCLTAPVLAPVVQRVGSTIHQTNHCPLDNSIGFDSTYPVDTDLFAGQRYPSFEELRPVLCCR